jgi:hypothetical protein
MILQPVNNNNNNNNNNKHTWRPRNVRSRLASACTNLSLEQASSNSGASHASCGSTLSTMRSSEARLFWWMCSARCRPMKPAATETHSLARFIYVPAGEHIPKPPTISTVGFSVAMAVVVCEGQSWVDVVSFFPAVYPRTLFLSYRWSSEAKRSKSRKKRRRREQLKLQVG